jgi:hypothetical protein
MNRRLLLSCTACAAAFVVASFTSLRDGGDSGTIAAEEVTAPIDSLVSPTGPGAAEPNLAVGPKGEVHLSWLEPADSAYSLKIATYAGGKWSGPHAIRTARDFFVNWADFPSVAVLGEGRLAAHWLQKTGRSTYAYGVRIAQSTDGGRTWSAGVTPHSDTMPVEHGFVAMWPDRGGVGAVWFDGRKTGASAAAGHEGHGEMMLMSTTIGRNGKVGAEKVVDGLTCECCQNSVAITGSGPIVAYRNRTKDEIRDIYVSRLVNGKWTEGTAVHADNWKINACPVNGPAIEASGRNVALAWFTGARDSNKVNVAFSTDGGAKFGAPIRVDGGQPGGRVDLVMLGDGSAVVSWLERTGDVAAVQARRVTASGQLGPVKTIAQSSAARASGVPRMVMSGSDLFFAWTVPTRPSSVRVARAAVSEFR